MKTIRMQDMRNVSGPSPILVIGMNRSGTKWLSNIISNHSMVYAIRTKRSSGIAETNMLTGFPKVFTDLTSPDDYVGLIELWARTDFMKLLAVSPDDLYKLKPRPTDCYSLFRNAMEISASRSDKKFWLQKSWPPAMSALERTFPDAFVINVRRNPVDVVKSTVALELRNTDRRRQLLSYVYSYARQRYLEERYLVKWPRNAIVYYSALADRPYEIVDKLCKKIGIAFEEGMLENTYRRNTSYNSRIVRNSVLTSSEIAYIRFLWAMSMKIPSIVYRYLDSGRSEKRTRLAFVPGTFGSIKDQYGL